MPLGSAALVAVSAGPFAYAAYRFVLAVVDPRDLGTGLGGLAVRFGRLVSAVLHAGLGAFAISLFAGGSGVGPSAGSECASDRTAELMSLPAGTWWVALVGLVVLGFGLRHVWSASRGAFADHYRKEDMTDRQFRVAKHIGRIGPASRFTPWSWPGRGRAWSGRLADR